MKETRYKKIFKYSLLCLVGIGIVLIGNLRAVADTTTANFEDFTLGGINGQDGWVSGGVPPNYTIYDEEVISNTYGYTSFGIKSLRVSNALTSDSFGDQIFSKSLINEAGETSASTSTFSGGVRQPYFEAEWDFASTVPESEQVGFMITMSPDEGDGARMSWLQLQDTASGFQLNFYDYQSSVSDFVLTSIATGIDRTVPHKVKMTMNFIDGPSNDVVKVYLDDSLIHTGTSWEDYARSVGGAPNPVDSIMFRISGTAVPANSGKGILIDNFSSFSGPVPSLTFPTVTSTDPINASDNISPGRSISALFSEAMNPATISSSTFSVKKGTVSVPGSISYSGSKATFIPDVILDQNSIYTATITTGATASSGNAMVADYTWNFTTSWNYDAWSDHGVGYTAPTGDAYYPSVFYDDNGFGTGSPKYAMWYSDGVGAVFLTTSMDGVVWGTSTTTVGLINVHHAQVVYDADCFGTLPCNTTTTKYKMWFWDMGAPTLYSISSMATADSADGIHWTNKIAVTQNPESKLIQSPDTGTGWNRGTYGPAMVLYQSEATNTGIEPWDYKYVMYYDGTDGGHEDTGLAYSADGLYWSAYTVNPVLSGSRIGGIDAWNCVSAIYGTVFKDSFGYHFFYSGKGQDDGLGGCAFRSDFNGIGYASSIDGKTWVKDIRPFFAIDDGVQYRSGRIYTPSVINDGSGVFRMYFSTKDASGGQKKIGYATLVAPVMETPPIPAPPPAAPSGGGGGSRYDSGETTYISQTSRISQTTELSGDNVINIRDWSIFLFRWSSGNEILKSTLDFNGDGKVDISDFSVLLDALRIR